jgi:hypothetical protein
MNAADLARLKLAQRAFRATEPSEGEVQTGVRRARLGLRRRKSQKRWLGKGLVLVVLAVGGLAFAKPQVLGQLLSQVGRSAPAPEQRSATPAGAAPLATQLAPSKQHPGADAQRERGEDEGALAATLQQEGEQQPAPPSAELRVAAPRSASAAARTPAASASAARPSGPGETTWGRVGRALSEGDEARALSLLAELSESAEQSTRDKADLGRAQLLMSRGNRDGACSLARELVERGANGSIARKARELFEGC